MSVLKLFPKIQFVGLLSVLFCQGALAESYYKKYNLEACPFQPVVEHEVHLEESYFPTHDHNQSNFGTCYAFAAYFILQYLDNYEQAYFYNSYIRGTRLAPWVDSSTWFGGKASQRTEFPVAAILAQGNQQKFRLNGIPVYVILHNLKKNPEVIKGAFPDYQDLMPQMNHIYQNASKNPKEVSELVFSLFQNVLKKNPKVDADEIHSIIEEEVRSTLDPYTLVYRILSRVPGLKQANIPNYNLHLYNYSSYLSPAKKSKASVLKKIEEIFSASEVQPVALTFCTGKTSDGNCSSYHAVTITGIREVKCGGQTHKEWYIYNSYGSGNPLHGWHMAEPLAKSFVLWNGSFTYLRPCVPKNSWSQYFSNREACTNKIIEDDNLDRSPLELLVRAGDEDALPELERDYREGALTPERLNDLYFHAVLSLNRTLTEWFLSQGVDVNSSYDVDKSALLSAVELEDPQVIERLLLLGASANLPDSTGMTPLFAALKATVKDSGAESASRKILNILLKSPAPQRDINAKTFPGGKSYLLQSLLKDDLATVDFILELGTVKKASPDFDVHLNLNLKDDNGETFLHHLFAKDLNQVKYWDLLQRVIILGADVNVADNRGVTPLHWAALTGTAQGSRVLSFLANHRNGAAVLRDSAQRTPFHYFGMRRIPSPGPAFLSHLQEAQGQGIIGSHFLNTYGSRDIQGKTPLHYAAGAPLSVLKDLLNGGSDPRAKDHNLVTPLHEAVRLRNVPVAKYLASILSAEDALEMDRSGSMPIEMAFNGGLSEIFGGRSPLQWVVALGDEPQVSRLLEKQSVRDTLDHQDLQGYTALHLAVMKEQIPIVHQLIKNGASLKIQNYGGLSPLEYAAPHLGRDMIQTSKLYAKKEGFWLWNFFLPWRN